MYGLISFFYGYTVDAMYNRVKGCYRHRPPFAGYY